MLQKSALLQSLPSAWTKQKEATRREANLPPAIKQPVPTPTLQTGGQVWTCHGRPRNCRTPPPGGEGRKVAGLLEMRDQLTCSPSSPGKQEPPPRCSKEQQGPEEQGREGWQGPGMAFGERHLGGWACAQEQTLSSETYVPRLLEGLGSLRTQDALCDVRLEAEGASFPAHKAILAVASSYCMVRFVGEAASQATRLRLAPSVTARGLRSVLSFVYSNRLELSLQTVEETFKAAEELLVREAMRLSIRFLEGTLDQHTCLRVLDIAQRLGSQELKRKALSYVSQQHREILQHPWQLQGLDRATLCEILDKGDPRGFSELALFQAATTWLSCNQIHPGDAVEVLQYIRFPLIPLPDLKKFLQEAPILMTDPACRQYLQEAFNYHAQMYMQPSLQGQHTQVHNGNTALVVLGGRSAGNLISEDVWAANRLCSLWKKIGRLAVPLYNHCVAVINDFVFIMGGQEVFDPTGQHPSNKVFRFDPRHDSWLQLASMLVRRTRFQAGALKDCLVAVGGGAPLGTLTATAEEYHLAQNEWRLITPCPVPVADHAGTTHRDIFYISGGFAAGQVSRDSYSYLPCLHRWIRNRPMAFARCDHGMAAVGDRIFCVGGRALTNAKEWVPVNEVESYSPVADQWAWIPLPSFGLAQFSLATNQLQLYITGGAALQQRRKEDGVFVYQVGRRMWEKTGSLPKALVDHACCFIHLPLQPGSTLPEEERELPGGEKGKPFQEPKK